MVNILLLHISYFHLTLSFVFFILIKRGLHISPSPSLTPISDLSIPAMNLPSTFTSEEMETTIITTSELNPIGFHDDKLVMTESKGNNIVVMLTVCNRPFCFACLG